MAKKETGFAVSYALARQVWAAVSAEPRVSSKTLARRMGKSTSQIHSALRCLEAMGYIRQPHGTRLSRVVLVPYVMGRIIQTEEIG